MIRLIDDVTFPSQNSSESCCDKCRGDARCNLWVWCGKPAGCGAGLRHQQCWLKHLVADPVDLTQPPGRRGPGAGLEAVENTTGKEPETPKPARQCWLDHLLAAPMDLMKPVGCDQPG